MNTIAGPHAPPPEHGPRPAQTGWFRDRRLRWIVRLAVLAVIVMIPLSCGFDHLFYYPDRRTYERPADYGLRHEEVEFDTADGVRLHGWFIPAQDAFAPPGARQRQARGTILHFHGNAANVSAHLVLIEWLPRSGYNVLMFDYRGYGRSAGRVSRVGTIADGHAAVDYVVTRPEFERGRLFAYGQSLGGAIAVVVAAERPEISAVIAESTFSSYRRIATLHGRRATLGTPLGSVLARWSVSAGHDPIDYVGRIAPRPLLVSVGLADTICFPELGRELFDAAREPKEYWEVPGAAHLEIPLLHQAELLRRMEALFERGRL